mmetsp:Transcript_115538/g.331629  ORF Transcript_115538/g.331629 Transcript_115538/m.331629 type:complete len:449 (-) Transcript_115538:54-1400(-)
MLDSTASAGELSPRTIGAGLFVRGAASLMGKARPAGTWPFGGQHGPRPADTWPLGDGTAIGLEEHYGETEMAGALALTFMAALKQCGSIPEVGLTAHAIEAKIGRGPFVRKALASVVDRRCCELLLPGFASVIECAEAFRTMQTLRAGELLTVQTSLSEAIRVAIVQTCHHVCGPGARSRGSMHATELWAQAAQMLAQFSEAGYLTPAEVADVEATLGSMLKGILSSASSQELSRTAAHLRMGGDCILRACASVAPKGAADMSPSGSKVPALPVSISTPAFDALRAAARLGGSSTTAAPGIYYDLQQLGFVDREAFLPQGGRSIDPSRIRSISQPAPDRSAPISRGEFVEDVLWRAARRAEALHHSRPTHVRSEVLLGVGAVGHAGAHSGAAQHGLAPAQKYGMTALQKSLLRVHAAKVDSPTGAAASQRIRALGKASPPISPAGKRA